MGATFGVMVLTAIPTGTGDGPGAFVKIDGREALLRSIELFLNRDNVKQIQACFLAEQFEEAKQKHSAHLSFSGVKVLSAGPRWIDQIVAGAAKTADEITHVIVHDAARPAVPYTDIEAMMAAAETSDAVALAAPVRTSLLELDPGGQPVGTRTASEFAHLLTPVCYSKKKLAEVAAKKQDVHASQWTIVKGSALNVRVGGASDASLVKAMIGLLPKPKLKAASSPFDEAQW